MVKKSSMRDSPLMWGFDESAFPRTHQFLGSQNPISRERLPSRWRKDNLLLRVSCEWQNYVVKKVDKEEGEIDKVKLMRRTYPSLTPRLFLTEGGDCYTMSYVNGRSFFNLNKEERIEQIRRAGELLSRVYFEEGENCSKIDISGEVRKGFERYRRNRKEFFNDDELNLSKKDFKVFGSVPNQLSHNDLNAANLMYDEEIKVIDPSEEGYNDIARDVGRYCASCFFNNYDYFGNDGEHSLAVADGFLKNFDESVLQRAKYYIGESFLSFLGFDTVTTSKSVLKKLAINTLTGEGNIMDLLEEGFR